MARENDTFKILKTVNQKFHSNYVIAANCHPHARTWGALFLLILFLRNLLETADWGEQSWETAESLTVNYMQLELWMQNVRWNYNISWCMCKSVVNTVQLQRNTTDMVYTCIQIRNCSIFCTYNHRHTHTYPNTYISYRDISLFTKGCSWKSSKYENFYRWKSIFLI